MSHDPKGARIRPQALALGAVLGLVLVQISSAQAPAVPASPKSPCVNAPPESPQACSGQPLQGVVPPAPSAPTPPKSPCFTAPAESPQACSGQPLDARDPRVTVRGGPIALPPGAIAHAYPEQLLVGGDEGALKSFTANGTLPRGMTLDAAGVLRGTPMSSGTFTFAVHAVDARGRSVAQTYALYVVGGAPTPKPPPPKPAPPPPPPKPPELPSEPVVERQLGIIDIYQVTADDVKALHKLLDKTAEPPPPVVVQNVSATTQTTQTTAGQTATGQAAPPQTSTVQTSTTSTTSTSQTVVPPPSNAPAKKRPTPFVIRLPSISGVSAPREVTRAVSDANNALKPVNGIMALFTPKGSAPKPSADGAPAGPVVAAVGDGGSVSLADKAGMLQDVTYPTRALFIRALAARYPPLTEDVNDAFHTVVDRAHKAMSFDAAPPLTWTPEAGCRCNQQPKNPDDKRIYGFVPFWGTGSPKGAAIPFSQFDRIEFIGAQLRPDGLWTRPSNAKDGVSTATWWARTSALASAAQAHGAQVDLVLQGADWNFLHGVQADAAREQGVMAAQNAMTWVETPLDGRGLRTLLFPFWHDPTHVFDGVTVMFSPPPPTAGKADQDAFNAFYDGLVLTLINDMQSDGRKFTLNLMPPEMLTDATAQDEDKIRADAPFWRDFLTYKKLAEPASAHKDQMDKERAVYVGKTDISVRLLTPVREPSQDEKKLLRATIDTITQVQGDGHVEEVRGADRVELLRSTIPILFLPSRNSAQLSDDLVFFNQNFGGMGLWPAPDSVVQKDVYQVLNQVLASDRHKSLINVSFCNFPVRLIWQIMLLLTPLALLAYAIWGRSSGRPWLWLGIACVFPAIALVLSGFLLEFDPIWNDLKVGNLPLLVLLCAVIGGVILLLRPRPPKP